MAKISKTTQQQQANRNKIILERLVEQHPERTSSSAGKQLPSDADEQSDLSVAGSTAKPKIRSKDLTGLKYFYKLAPLLERLHDDGCKRDKADNRDLHFDQYCMLKPVGRDSRLSGIHLTLTLVDGTLIAALPKLMQASVLKSQTGSGMVKWRP